MTVGADSDLEWTAVEVGFPPPPVAETEVAGMTVAFQVSERLGRHVKVQLRMAAAADRAQTEQLVHAHSRLSRRCYTGDASRGQRKMTHPLPCASCPERDHGMPVLIT